MNGKQLKNSILQWAIQGKLVPQDPNDEPASVLLDKIRQEKERLIKEKKIKRDKNASIIYRGEDNSYYEKILATEEVKCIDEEIPFEIPQGWEWCRLVEVGKTETGTTPSKSHPEYFGDYIPFLGPANILNSKIVSVTQGLSDIGVDYGRIVPKNTILQVCIGGSIGKCAITDKPVTFNQQINSITPYLCNVEFVHIVLQSEYFRLAIMDKATGTATPIINRGNWETLLFPLPPINEQERIVANITELTHFLGIYSNKQEELNKLNSNMYQRLKKAILQEAIQGKLVPQIAEEGTAQDLLKQIKEEKLKLVKEGKLKKSALNDSVIFRSDDNKYYEQIGKKCLDITELIPFEIPNSWTWARMGQIGDWGAGSTPQRSNQDYYGGNILWLKTGELNNGVICDTEERITQRAFQECSLRMNKIGDVLIAMYGATIGKLAIVGKELTTNQACCGCTPYIVYNWFLFYFLMASRDTFIKKGEGGAQPNISRVKLVEHLIPLPPLNEQKRIVERIETLFEQL
ncbi:restriction endonuclease subunit S [Bacteroides xylanisolvens]|uniref:restriction endonuclease subunit S n=1 Tax=Bacteroides xylanisolvens TaxID=371601 RepID=UPI0022E7F428|nr:restriction endonuclease subunit S [Bacteroides xylanisolvens]